jgi:hypothetical protein
VGLRMALKGKFMDKMKIQRKCPPNPVKEKIEKIIENYRKNLNDIKGGDVIT